MRQISIEDRATAWTASIAYNSLNLKEYHKNSDLIIN